MRQLRSTPSPVDSRIGPLGNRLLAHLDREGRRVIALPEDWPLVEQGVRSDRRSAQELLNRLSASGWLRRVRRGAYVIVDRTATARPGALELVGRLSRDPYLVSGGRALTELGLSDQAYRRIVVVSSHEQRAWTWRGERVNYITVAPTQIWGRSKRRVGETDTWIARAERAILDSLARPRWGVSLSQVVEALDRALSRDPAFAPALARASERYGQTSISRRVGFLVERLTNPETAEPFLSLVGTDPKATPLRASEPSEGDLDSRWRVRINVPFELLLDHREGG